ncbi:hypothetical protein CMV_013569 [Castanea mollissima]|uniref:Uncharacterized protein n=1 Tax=Castanea mollissima TaxID=60419 RepID=A0A8J4VLT0_9ROSI|nr:hypothetical protein CMV_013569 [Castanea mollissima]
MRKKADFPRSPCEGEGLVCEELDVLVGEGCNLGGLRFRGGKVFPTANPAVLDQLSNVDCIVYAMGSLVTSICPSLVLLGIGEIISSRSCRKVLVLNSTHDRETSGFSASCFVTAITDALNRTYGDPHNCLKNHPSQYINTLLVPKDGEIPVDVQCLAVQGIFDVINVDSIHDPKMQE